MFLVTARHLSNCFGRSIRTYVLGLIVYRYVTDCNWPNCCGTYPIERTTLNCALNDDRRRPRTQREIYIKFTIYDHTKCPTIKTSVAKNVLRRCNVRAIRWAFENDDKRSIGDCDLWWLQSANERRNPNWFGFTIFLCVEKAFELSNSFRKHEIG